MKQFGILLMCALALSHAWISAEVHANANATYVPTRTDMYFAASDKIYGELYDKKALSQPVWEALLNRSHYLFYTARVHPKTLYIATLAFASDIENWHDDEEGRGAIRILGLRDGYYALSKEVYFRLYKGNRITKAEYAEYLEEARKNIYEANSRPKKIYDTALEVEKAILAQKK